MSTREQYSLLFDKLKVCSMGQPIHFKKRKVVVSYFHKKKITLTLKYLHIVARGDLQVRTVGSLVLHDGSQLSKTRSPGYICRYRKALYFESLGISLHLELFCFLKRWYSLWRCTLYSVNPLPRRLAKALWHGKAMAGQWVIRVHEQRDIFFALTGSELS